MENIENVQNMEINKNKYISGLVSIIIPTYNRYELLIHCIKSCLTQTYKNIEVIVVNDHSTDERYYSGKLEALSEKVRVLHLEINQRIKYNAQAAQGMTRQCGLDIARGEWCAFLDDDDFFLQDKVQIQLNQMKNYNFLFSSTNMFMVKHNSIPNGDYNDELDMEIMGLYFQKNDVPKCLTKNIVDHINLVNNSSVILHRSVIDLVGSFEPIKFEDWNYWFRALQYVKCLYIEIPLVYYTRIIDENGVNKHNKNYVY
jgi:glycosyltransferase involved in cell wall biosynthesis